MGILSNFLGRRRLIGVVGGAVVAFCGSVGVGAGPSGADAEDVIRRLANDIWTVVQRTDLDDSQRRRQLVETIDGYTDVVLLGRLALGRHWRALNDQQRQIYERLFKEVVIGSLARRLTQYTADVDGSLGERFQVLGNQPAGKSDVLVRSQLDLPRGAPVTLDWRLRQRDDDIVVIDLAVEGVSLLVSQRSEFAAVIERSDMDGLLAELQARAASTGS